MDQWNKLKLAEGKTAENWLIYDYAYSGYAPGYDDGLRIFDISDPYNPNQIIFYDTYLPNSYNSYKGAWGVYPNLSSGNIIVSDMQTGLYIIALINSTPTIIRLNSPNNIYPNPIIDKFTIHSDAEKILIYNNLGLKIKEEKLSLFIEKI